MDIILIHGANQSIHDEAHGAEMLKKQWIGFIKSGFVKNGYDTSLLNKANFKFLYYADLGASLQPFALNNLEEMSQHAKTLFESQILELELDQPQVVSTQGFKDFLIDRVLSLLQGKFKYVDKLFVKVVFKEALYYVENKNYVADIQKRLNIAIGNSKNYMIISHSLGTMVAYTHACNAQPNSIYKLITMGSPLAIKFVHSLRQDPLVIPPSLQDKKWINLYDEEDFVAVYPLNKPKYEITPAIDNRIVNTIDDKPHNIQGYLESSVFCKLLRDELIKL